jgi:hypothetical protein
MRYWGPNIKISGDWLMDSPDRNNDNARSNPNADQFEKQTQDVLRDISLNAVGKPVLDAFTTAKHAVTIRPLTANAVGKMRSGPIFEDKALQTNIGSPGAAGPGSDCTVWFYGGGVSVRGHLYRSDDSLLHESFHALRQARGHWRAVHMNGWDNREELYATIVTNIFASKAKRNSDMRASHSPVFTLMQQTDGQFSTEYFSEILDLRSSMLDMFPTLAAIKDCWNPLRVFEDNFWNGR